MMCEVLNLPKDINELKPDYSRSMECAECGTIATAPTPVDMEEEYYD